MPSSIYELNLSAAPNISQTVKNNAYGFGQGDKEAIERDLRKLKDDPFPSRALSWNKYDQDIQNLVNKYNEYLRNTPGYRPLDWHLIKAMVWTESGPSNDQHAWDNFPMQAGNPGDTGWPDLSRQSDKRVQVVPPGLESAVMWPRHSADDNIAAGIAILLLHAAYWGPVQVIDKKNVKTVTIQKGDSLYIIAKRAGTTEQVLKDMNSSIRLDPLKPGLVLKYAPAKTIIAITGWRSIDTQSVYSLYNSHKGSEYTAKVDFLYNLIKRNKILN